MKIIKYLMNDGTEKEIRCPSASLEENLAIAKEEGITVMVEGIDDEKQKELVSLLGCDLAEGKVFGFLSPNGRLCKGYDDIAL